MKNDRPTHELAAHWRQIGWLTVAAILAVLANVPIYYLTAP